MNKIIKKLKLITFLLAVATVLIPFSDYLASGNGSNIQICDCADEELPKINSTTDI